MGRLARRIVMAATIPRDAQPEWLECCFGAYAHRVVRDMCPWINLLPLAICAHPPVGCGHCRLLQRITCLKTPPAEGTHPRAAGRVAPRPHRPSHSIRTLPSPPSSRNIYTAAVALPAPMGVGRVSSGRRGGRRLAGEGRRRHTPAQNEGQSCDDDQCETRDTPGDDGETRHQN
jgi:hypothetical protein